LGVFRATVNKPLNNYTQQGGSWAINIISPGRRFYDLSGSGESSSFILFIIHMATAILPSSTIFGTDF
jgi:hypothetical protein